MDNEDVENFSGEDGPIVKHSFGRSSLIWICKLLHEKSDEVELGKNKFSRQIWYMRSHFQILELDPVQINFARASTSFSS